MRRFTRVGRTSCRRERSPGASSMIVWNARDDIRLHLRRIERRRRAVEQRVDLGIGVAHESSGPSARCPAVPQFCFAPLGLGSVLKPPRARRNRPVLHVLERPLPSRPRRGRPARRSSGVAPASAPRSAGAERLVVGTMSVKRSGRPFFARIPFGPTRHPDESSIAFAAVVSNGGGWSVLSANDDGHRKRSVRQIRPIVAEHVAAASPTRSTAIDERTANADVAEDRVRRCSSPWASNRFIAMNT